MIQATKGKLHWNYFLALENDLGVISRYVEFAEPNYDAYSIEFAHLLFAAASEVDVVAKLLCQRLQPNAKRNNIEDYGKVLLGQFSYLPTMEVLVPRYGLTLTPWADWAADKRPLWWQAYNAVKHERDLHFQKATLKNALNALSALLILTNFYYSYELSGERPRLLPLDLAQQLEPPPSLLRFDGDYKHKYT